MASDGLNIFQQVYSQAFGVDLAGTLVGTESSLQQALNKGIDQLMSDSLGKYGWQVTWGPRLWKHPQNLLLDLITGPDNSWYAAECKNVKFADNDVADACVVAIAGTAETSGYDWFVQDFGVSDTVDFNQWNSTWSQGGVPAPQASAGSASGEYAAIGTCTGIYELLRNTAPAGRPGEGTTLLQYLNGLPSSTRIIVTGHSLGGALSPMLAYGLSNANLINTSSVYVLPAAGATPGNQNIATAFGTDFNITGTSGYQVWNSNLVNKRDVVPQAWCSDPTVSPDFNLDRITTIYGTLSGDLSWIVRGLVTTALAKVYFSGILYWPLQHNPFEGPAPAEVPQDFTAFITEVSMQHTTAYHDEVGVSELIQPVYTTMAASPGVHKQNLKQVASRMPVAQHHQDKHLPDNYANIHPWDVILKKPITKASSW